MSDNTKPFVPLNRVIPRAPLGVLGAFVQHKLKTYQEPSREGTPKGQPIGFSRGKYHAALLSSMTALDLKGIAREAKVSHGVLRGWRLEDEFFNVGFQGIEEFAESVFDTAAKASAIMLCDIHKTVTFTISGGAAGDRQEAKAQLRRHKQEHVVGFDDASLYSQLLLSVLIDNCSGQFRKAMQVWEGLGPDKQLGEEALATIGQYLAWVYAINAIERTNRPRVRREASERQRVAQTLRQEVPRYLCMILQMASCRSIDEPTRGVIFNVSRILMQLVR